jgi:hypothetical protein
MCGSSPLVVTAMWISDFVFFVPGALETVREKKRDLKMTSG